MHIVPIRFTRKNNDGASAGRAAERNQTDVWTFSIFTSFSRQYSGIDIVKRRVLYANWCVVKKKTLNLLADVQKALSSPRLCEESNFPDRFVTCQTCSNNVAGGDFLERFSHNSRSFISLNHPLYLLLCRRDNGPSQNKNRSIVFVGVFFSPLDFTYTHSART